VLIKSLWLSTRKRVRSIARDVLRPIAWRPTSSLTGRAMHGQLCRALGSERCAGHLSETKSGGLVNAKGKKTGGRRQQDHCSVAPTLATGRSMLQIMTDNAREMDATVQKLSERLAKALGENSEQILVYRDRAQRYARDCGAVLSSAAR
jgi:hypothetical protein